MHRRLLVLVAVVLVLVGVGWATVRAQEPPGPGEPEYFASRLTLLLETPTVDHSSDQMVRLLAFLWSDSMVRAGSLLLNPALETDPELLSQLIAETGVWEATYRAALELPPVADPQFASMQVDILEAMRLSVDASAGVRDFAMTGDEASLTQVLPTIEAIGALTAPYAS